MADIRRISKEDRFDELVDYGKAVRNFCSSRACSGLGNYFDGGPLLQELVDKLPPNERLNWYYYQNSSALPLQNSTTLADFNEWVKELVRAANRGVNHTSARKEVPPKTNNFDHERKPGINIISELKNR
uniref:Uncharacterized protein n=1 Tax=Anopheles epiroticus TaxID=199890 RepID=A0A182PX09_9DIPT